MGKNMLRSVELRLRDKLVRLDVLLNSSLSSLDCFLPLSLFRKCRETEDSFLHSNFLPLLFRLRHLPLFLSVGSRSREDFHSKRFTICSFSLQKRPNFLSLVVALYPISFSKEYNSTYFNPFAFSSPSRINLFSTFLTLAKCSFLRIFLSQE